MWRRNWEQLTPFFAYPADIRKVIYTTNAIESLNMSLRKVIKTRGSFPNADAAMKLLYPGAGAYCQEVDHAGAELEGGLAAFCDSARRPRPARRAGIAAAGEAADDSREPRISGASANSARRPQTTGRAENLLFLNEDEKDQKRRINCGPWKSGNPKPGFPLSHRPD